MQINLTDPILLNITLNSDLTDSSRSWWIVLIGIVIGALTSGSVQFIIEQWKSKNLEKANKVQLHSKLLGCKHAITQYFHSYFLSNVAARSSQPYAKTLAVALIDFTPAKKDLEKGKLEDATKYVNKVFASEYDKSVDLKESLRSRERSENLQLQLGDVNERFWGSIGQIRASFKDARIRDFIKEIEIAEATLGGFDKEITKTFDEIEIELKAGLNSICLDKETRNKYAGDPNRNRDEFVDATTKKINEAKESSIKDAKDKIDIFESKIDDLLNYMEKSLDNTQYCRYCETICSKKTCAYASQVRPKDGI